MGILSRVRRRVAVPLALLAPPALAAQRPGGAELGAFAALTSFAPRFDLRVGLGAGVRAGYFLNPAWSVEVEAAAQRAGVAGGGASVSLTLADLLVLRNFGRVRPAWYLVGGYARPSFTSSPPGRFGDDAILLGAGHRVFVGQRVAVRGDIRGLYTFRSGLGGRGAGHIVATAGVSFFTRGGPPPDADGDGVTDDRDACPRTHPGATVDVRGCPSDSDGDGVLDGLDRCPNSPFGALVDPHGCPADTDQDGIYDGIDQCPETPSGVAVDGRGCPLDADADGVADSQDRCPETRPGTTVDATGCPLASSQDTDGDGVDDAHDRCPATPPATAVDSLGCRILFRTEHDSLVLEGVTFESGRSRLSPASATVLDDVAASLLASPDVRIEIAGYTDNTGSTALNTRLSKARAAAVRSYLAARGVAPDRMTARGYGPASPVASNDTPEGRARNRRVELHRQ